MTSALEQIETLIEEYKESEIDNEDATDFTVGILFGLRAAASIIRHN